MNHLKTLMDMTGRLALITGAAGGLGRIMSETLAEMGADLVLVDLPSQDLSSQKEQLTNNYGITVYVVHCDLEDCKWREQMIEEVLGISQALDVLINNAAFVGTSSLEGWCEPFENQSVETWRRALEVNLTSAFHLCRDFAPALGRSVGGSIINIGSIYGEYGPDWTLYADTNMANAAAYGASKAGLIQFTRWLATTIAPNTRANIISPGGILRGQPDTFITRYKQRTPLYRMASENDFRGAVAYLASDMSAYVTGQVLRVDGGWGVW